MNKEEFYKIPEEVAVVSDILKKTGFESYLVGGCVRDLFLSRKPSDWDIATNAVPEEIVPLFTHTYYENEFGTVGVVNEEASDQTLESIEVTTYRKEGAYSDKRRPDSVTFSKKIEDDLSRRDFTINAMALSLAEGERNIASGELVDLFEGKKDLKEGLVRAVGDPEVRFAEDGLRIIRAVRFASELEFEIEKETEKAILSKRETLGHIANERIGDEFTKIIMSPLPATGVELLKKMSLLEYVVPELEEAIGIEQGGVHKYDVFEHLNRALQHTADRDYSLEVRLAALLHDISKPETRRTRKTGTKEYSFFGHEVLGARKAKKILERLKYPNSVIEKVTKLVRWHMFFMDTEEITLSAVRRLIRNVGKENIWLLMELRTADRIGSGVPKEKPYRLRKYQSMIEEALRDPISVGQLNIDGGDIMEITKSKPGPRIGWILHALLEEVLDDPKKNSKDYLNKKILELRKLSDEELRSLGEQGMVRKEGEEEKDLKDLRKKYHVE